jgi:tRNA (guanosine-2'-O-)-methyltransferase
MIVDYFAPVVFKTPATSNNRKAGESLNLSVAAAMVLFEAQRQRKVPGMYQQRHLPDPEYDRTLFEWAHPRVAQHCRRHGLAYPALDESGGIADSLEREKTAK